jgi:hypothetical protein
MTAQTPDLEALQKRLRKVEKRAREMYIGLCILLLLLLAGGYFVFTYAFQTGTMMAKAYALQDSEGNDRAILGIKKGEVFLGLCDKEGGFRANLSVGEDGQPRLFLQDKYDRKRLEITLLWNGRPVIALYDREKRLALLAGVNEFGESFIHVYDKDQVPQISLETHTDGQPRLEMIDKRGNTLFKAP